MVRIWQAEMGISQPGALTVWVRQLFGVKPAPRNQQNVLQPFSHREALLKLGYFNKRRFALHPVKVGTPEFTKLCETVAIQTGQQPTAQFDFDEPLSPTNVCGLTVYAPPKGMPSWEQFVAGLQKH
jgi:hypothetical protein